MNSFHSYISLSVVALRTSVALRVGRDLPSDPGVAGRLGIAYLNRKVINLANNFQNLVVLQIGKIDHEKVIVIELGYLAEVNNCSKPLAFIKAVDEEEL